VDEQSFTSAHAAALLPHAGRVHDAETKMESRKGAVDDLRQIWEIRGK
jgi:hypothetical protein